MNSRMVQSNFDDLNPATRQQWAYADTQVWDADRNTREFLDAMPAWHEHGLLAVTLNLQGEMVKETRHVEGYRKMPILFNEDDHFQFDKPENNFIAAIDEYASWGYFDFRMKDETFADGYQSVPVDWTIGSDRKRGFFRLLKTITKGQ